MMTQLKRQSPVRFNMNPTKTEVRDNWTVALEYDSEGRGPWIVDLSHKIRWDLQDSKIQELNPCEMNVPKVPGDCAFSGSILMNRMNRTQASIYHLGNSAPELPDFAGYTNVSESTAFLALFGPKVFYMAEKLTNLDFMNPSRQTPFLLQGPFCHIPCHIAALEKDALGGGGFLLSFSRGYADTMIHAILEAGEEFGLHPAGENRFNAWIEGLPNN